jgi:hypothetical protein
MLERVYAHHDAGHALVAFLQERELPELRIGENSFPTPKNSVPVKARSADPFVVDDGLRSTNWTVRARLEDETTLWLAGIYAVLESMPETVRIDTEHEFWGEDDYLYVESLLAELEGSSLSRTAYETYLQERTKDLLRKHWVAVQTLVSALVERRGLTPNEVRTLLQTNVVDTGSGKSDPAPRRRR